MSERCRRRCRRRAEAPLSPSTARSAGGATRSYETSRAPSPYTQQQQAQQAAAQPAQQLRASYDARAAVEAQEREASYAAVRASYDSALARGGGGGGGRPLPPAPRRQINLDLAAISGAAAPSGGRPSSASAVPGGWWAGRRPGCSGAGARLVCARVHTGSSVLARDQALVQ